MQTGVINEGLRLGIGPLMHLPRAAMNETLQYKDYVIPPGVSRLSRLRHQSELLLLILA